MPPSDDLDRRALIAQARQGQPGALDRLLGLYRNYLRFLARAGLDEELRGKSDPSDLVQEALLKASQRFDQFQGSGEAELTGWLRQILCRCLSDHARRYRREGRKVVRERSLEQLLDRSSQDMANVLASQATTPSGDAERRDLAVVLADVLADLSPDYRDVLVLHELEGLDWPEVARRMERSPGAVRMLWTRALKQLRPLLEARLGPIAGGPS